MIPIYVILLIVRKFMIRDVRLLNLFISFAVSSLVFLPQLYNNVIQFNHWTILIHDDLYGFQSKAAATYLKYGTVVIPDEIPQLFYTSPFPTSTDVSIYGLISENFWAFLVVYCAHLFAALDWGYIHAYITNFYAPSRLLGSVCLYIYWILSFCGIFFTVKEKKSRIEKFILISLLGSCVGYLSFIGGTVVESRFGFPLFLILLPFSAIAFSNLVNFIFGSDKFWIKRITFKTMLQIISFVALVSLFFLISFLIDRQTGRINWF